VTCRSTLPLFVHPNPARCMFTFQVVDDRTLWDRFVAAIASVRFSLQDVVSSSLSTRPVQAVETTNAAFVRFIESPDPIGSGGVDRTTGLLRAHKWSAQAALHYLDTLDAVDASKEGASPSVALSESPATAAAAEPRLWSFARSAIAQLLANAAACEADLAPAHPRSPTTSADLSYEFIGIDLLPDADGK
jgi:hypothetical protein